MDFSVCGSVNIWCTFFVFNIMLNTEITEIVLQNSLCPQGSPTHLKEQKKKKIKERI